MNILTYLICLIVLALICPAKAWAETEKQDLEEYINSLNVEETTELIINLKSSNSNIVPTNIKRLVNLEKITIGSRVKINTSDIYALPKLSKNPFLDSQFNKINKLPIELFNLPNLKELVLFGPEAYSFYGNLNELNVNSNFNKLTLYYFTEDKINLWPAFKNIKNLNIQKKLF